MAETETYSDAHLRDILNGTRTIAVVGASTNPIKPSYFLGTYFQSRGFRVIPINPGSAGERLFGETVLASIADIPKGTQVDMLSIFRRSDAVPQIFEEAMEHLVPGLNVFWMQYNVRHPEVAAKARAAGITVIQDKCPKVEHMRLMGGLRPIGMTTGLVSSKRPPLSGR